MVLSLIARFFFIVFNPFFVSDNFRINLLHYNQIFTRNPYFYNSMALMWNCNYV